MRPYLVPACMRRWCTAQAHNPRVLPGLRRDNLYPDIKLWEDKGPLNMSHIERLISKKLHERPDTYRVILIYNNSMYYASQPDNVTSCMRPCNYLMHVSAEQMPGGWQLGPDVPLPCSIGQCFFIRKLPAFLNAQETERTFKVWAQQVQFPNVLLFYSVADQYTCLSRVTCPAPVFSIAKRVCVEHGPRAFASLIAAWDLFFAFLLVTCSCPFMCMVTTVLSGTCPSRSMPTPPF